MITNPEKYTVTLPSSSMTVCSCALPACLEKGCIRNLANQFPGDFPPTPYEELMDFIIPKTHNIFPEIKMSEKKKSFNLSEQDLNEIRKHLSDPTLKWNILVIQEDCKKLLAGIESLRGDR